MEIERTLEDEIEEMRNLASDEQIEILALVLDSYFLEGYYGDRPLIEKEVTVRLSVEEWLIFKKLSGANGVTEYIIQGFNSTNIQSGDIVHPNLQMIIQFPDEANHGRAGYNRDRLNGLRSSDVEILLDNLTGERVTQNRKVLERSRYVSE